MNACMFDFGFVRMLEQREVRVDGDEYRTVTLIDLLGRRWVFQPGFGAWELVQVAGVMTRYAPTGGLQVGFKPCGLNVGTFRNDDEPPVRKVRAKAWRASVVGKQRKASKRRLPAWV